MRTQPLQQYIGRDLEEDIRHEKDGQSDISLLAHEMQLRWQTHGQGIGYVDSRDFDGTNGSANAIFYGSVFPFYRSRKDAT